MALPGTFYTRPHLQRVSDPATVRDVHSHLGGWTPTLPSRSRHRHNFPGPRMQWTLSQEWLSPRLPWLCPSSPLLPPACPTLPSGPFLQHRQPAPAPCSPPHRCACGYDRVAGVFSVPGSVLRALRARSHTISQQPIKKVLGWPFLPGEDSEAQGESATHPESPGVTRKKSDCKTDLSPSCSSASHRPKPGLSPPGVLANRLDGSAPSRSISQNKTFYF